MGDVNSNPYSNGKRTVCLHIGEDLSSADPVVGYFALDLKIFPATNTPAIETPIESTSVTGESCMRTGICMTLLFPSPYRVPLD